MSRVDEEDQRWIDAGRVLRLVCPKMFDVLLYSVEVMIAETPEPEPTEAA